MSIHAASDFISRPFVAVSTSLGSVLVSLIPHLETGFRLSTLFLGFLVALLSLRKMWKDRNK